MTDLTEAKKALGLVQIYTGNGKGKSTAAFGLAFRAAGRGFSVLIIQFLKPLEGFGEQTSCCKFANISLMPLGLGHFVSGNPGPEDVEAAKKALAKTVELMSTGKYDVVVLDEAVNAVRLNLLTDTELIEALEKRPANIEVVMTGRGITPALEEYADLVTEMKLVKHPYDRGIPARVGIEY